MSLPNDNIQNRSDSESAFRDSVKESFDGDIAAVATEHDKEGLLTTIQSFSLHFIKQASKKSQAEPEAVSRGLELLWYMFIETAKVVGHDDAYQEKLIALLVWTREFDASVRSLHADASDSNGWEDYGFSQSLDASWETLLANGLVSEQCNLAAFSAKVLAADICSDGIALTTLRHLAQTLEAEGDAKTVSLLPATVLWVKNCRHRLLTLSATNKQYRQDGMANRLVLPPSYQNPDTHLFGFSIDRWLHWRRRLQELSHHSDTTVAMEAKKGFMIMVNCGRELSYDVPGEARFAEKLQKAMWDELVRTGKNSVESDEIDVDVDWVN